MGSVGAGMTPRTREATLNIKGGVFYTLMATFPRAFPSCT